MPKLKVLTGNTYGRLSVIGWADSTKSGHRWLCKCICGNEKVIYGCTLKTGGTTSCGCYRKEMGIEKGIKNLKSKSKKHGHCSNDASTYLYSTWGSMKARCLNEKDKDYHHYGGRNIKVYEPWINDFQLFCDYIGERPSEKHSIDREDVNGDYAPGNIKWATWQEQARNRRVQCKSKTGVKGVRISRNKFRAYITVDGKDINLGTHETIEEAKQARLAGELKYWNKSS